MVRYLKKIIFYTFCVFLLLFVGEYIVTNGLKKSRYKDFGEINDVFDGKINADVLILGGSDAVQHFSTTIIDSVLNLKSYNLGLNGHNFMMSYCMMENFLEKHSYPKIIIQAADVKFLRKRPDLYNYQLFLPYLSNSKISTYTKKYEGLSWEDYFLPFVRYSGELDLIKIGFSEFFNLKRYFSQKNRGYIGISRPWDPMAYDLLKENYPNKVTLHDQSVFLFKKYLLEAKENGTKIFLVSSPYYLDAQKYTVNRDSILDLYKEMAYENQVEFLDYSNSSLSGEQTNFYDYAHLNKNASQKFSTELALEIKGILNSN